MTEKFEKIRL